ncbi:TetR family transcriptional regulator [Murinocardiopsis flavida]|uniref:TetR family transcriptional regulator n=1 Tax=Murinocardiopsis flavida TaxID=645275 RepID=A0A2P8DU10_9ACTN|nr:TetR/AcrR family transcriptional regulator [Murinocardiopsis flavida]PSL00706.1 TetR family transcriptional regulator [Murinocardiopsis flavida]
MHTTTHRGGRASGPRDAEAIFAATLGLLAEGGYDALTVEGAAARSGVNKTTIYRWWRSKDELIGAALVDSRLLEPVVPDTGSLEGDLVALARHIIGLLTGEPTRDLVTAVLAAAGHRPELARHAKVFFADRLSKESPVFARAVQRGELAADADPAALMDLLGGAIWFRLVIRSDTMTPDDAAPLVRTLLSGAARSS